MAFGRCRPGPSRSSRLCRPPWPKPRHDSPRELGLSFKALAKALETPLGGSSSHGIRRVPLHRHAQRASTPGGRSLRWTDGATRQSRSALVVSHHLDGLLRTKGCGSVAPRCQSRVRRVSCLPASNVARGRQEGVGYSPRDAVHTLRRVSLVSSRTASLRPLPSCRYRSPLDCGVWPKPLSALDRVRPEPNAKPTGLAPEGVSRVGCGADYRYGDAPIRRSGPPRHRSATASDRPKPSAVGAHNRVLARDAEAARCQGARSSHCRAGHGPASCCVAWGRRATRGWSFDPPAAEAASRCAAPRRSHRGGSGERARRNPRSGRLQGLAPLTSPLCHAAVASEMTLDPSMGFVPLQGPSYPVPARRCRTDDCLRRTGVQGSCRAIGRRGEPR
jgi:hypothetical protein